MENKITRANDLVYPVRKMDTINFTSLTKREYFAAMAMQGLLANDSCLITSKARDAVKAADALIEELNKTKDK